MVAILWSFTKLTLADFSSKCVNGIHSNAQFTMETEEDGHLPCLDTDICKRPSGYLGPHSFKEGYSHMMHHLPANKHSLLPQWTGFSTVNLETK
jgi:hypothetical protein